MKLVGDPLCHTRAEKIAGHPLTFVSDASLLYKGKPYVTHYRSAMSEVVA